MLSATKPLFSGRPAGRRSGGWRLLHVGLLIAAFIPFFAVPVFADEGDIEDCFEGPAADLAARAPAQDPTARKKAEMQASKTCERPARRTIMSCLRNEDDEDADDQNYRGCIGQVALPCIESDWATSSFRRTVCLATEERIWRDILNNSFERLKGRLPNDQVAQVAQMEKDAFKYRDEKCRLRHALEQGPKADVAFGVCMTRTTAQFAIDMREMAKLAGGKQMPVEPIVLPAGQ